MIRLTLFAAAWALSALLAIQFITNFARSLMGGVL
jgi:hypothetical protein